MEKTYHIPCEVLGSIHQIDCVGENCPGENLVVQEDLDYPPHDYDNECDMCYYGAH